MFCCYSSASDLSTSPASGPSACGILTSPASGPSACGILTSPASGPSACGILTSPASGPSACGILTHSSVLAKSSTSVPNLSDSQVGVSSSLEFETLETNSAISI